MSEPSVIGWEPMQAEWWLVIRASIPQPWPREAVLMDLRFWRGQEVATAHRVERLRVKRPGRPTLLREWGWTDWAVKEAFRAEDEWCDPRREDSASTPPALRQHSASTPPAVQRLEVDNLADSASTPPALRQHSASEPPRARSLLTDPPITDHRGEGEPPTPQPPEPSQPEAPGASGGAPTHPVPPESNQGHARGLPGPSLPVPAEGDLLPLLTSQLQMGQAAAAGRLLHAAGIHTVADAAPLDEWEIGRIVGTNHKVGTLKALREGGWMPPRERAARPPPPAGCPPGVKSRTLFSQIGKEEPDAQHQRRSSRAS